MKHISLRIDDRDYEFIRNLARKKKIRESNLFREVFHDFVLRSTGQTSLSEIESIVRRMSDELRDLDTRIARLEGQVLPSILPFSFSQNLSPGLTEGKSEEQVAEIEAKREEPWNDVEKAKSNNEGSSADLLPSASYNQALGEILHQFAKQQGSKIESQFLGHCVSAAENASKVHDYSQATKYYRIALELARGDIFAEGRAIINEKIADLEYLMGENDLALKYWNDALSFFLHGAGEDKDKAIAAANVYRKIGLMYVQGVYERDKGLGAFKEALRLLGDDGSKEIPEIAAVYASMARLYWRTGENLREAQKLCEKALRIAQKFSLREVEAEAHQTLGFLLPITEKKEILNHFQSSLRLSIENGFHDVACRAYNNLGYVYVVIGGDMKKSIQLYLEGLRLERRIKHVVMYTYTKLALSLYAYIPMGEWTKAKESVDEFLPELSTQHPYRFASAFQVLGEIALRRGEYELSEQYFNAYLPIAIKAKEVQAIIPCYVSLGILYFEKFDYVRAEEYLRSALDSCRKIGLELDNCMRYANCLSVLSRVCVKQGKVSEASSLVSELFLWLTRLMRIGLSVITLEHLPSCKLTKGNTTKP
jgi:tetratricopeptide (TPR) repeat protein